MVIFCTDEETQAKKADPGPPTLMSKCLLTTPAQTSRAQPKALLPPAHCPERAGAPGASSGPPSLPCPHVVSSWAWQLCLGNTLTSQHLQSSPWARPPSPLTGL